MKVAEKRQNANAFLVIKLKFKVIRNIETT